MRISDWSSDVCSSDLHGYGCSLAEGRRRRELFEAPSGSSTPHYGAERGSRKRQHVWRYRKHELQDQVEAPRQAWESHITLNSGLGLTNAASLIPRGRHAPENNRSEERRGGKEGVSTFRSRGSPDH